MADVEFSHVDIRYPGAESPTVPDLNLSIGDGEFLVLVGPSGCGKSTILRSLAGLEPTSAGTITIGGRDVTGVEPGDRDIAMVFQDYALYPHMSVRENMGFALSIAKRPKAEIADRVQRAAELLDLGEYLDRKPKDLSGGQRQRVAMGRAIVREPQVFLMDEPLSNLDAKLRVQTRAQIVKLQHDLGVTTVYVTHDQVEAMTMGDRVAVLRDGRAAAGRHPAEALQRTGQRLRRRLHRFSGDEPAGTARPARMSSEGLGVRRPEGVDGALLVGVRPEHLVADDHRYRAFPAPSRWSRSSVRTRTSTPTPRPAGSPRSLWRRPRTCPTIGGSVSFTLTDTARVHFFDAVSGQRVN
jgi:multiple sugar transport system ATP-binding protein